MFRINDQMLEVNRFPDETVRLNLTCDSAGVVIEWLFEKDEEMILYFITMHLKNSYPLKKITLKMPYIPHARMDRVKNESEVFTLKYFCDFINHLRFDKVIVRDAHSTVSLALLNNVVCEDITENITYLVNKLLIPESDILFYPDEGSFKRYSELLQFPCAFGIKKRDWNTGKILGLDVQGTIPCKAFNALIIDDISSFGGTFLYSAKKLKELGADKVYLYITHCENSILKGELIDSGLIEKIYTSKSIFTDSHPLIEVIGVKSND